MNLKKKKTLAVSVLGIGRERIVFNTAMLSDIKEAITRQDIKDLLNSGAIIIKDIKGRKKIEKRKNRRRAGSRKNSPNKGKRTYINITRKLRAYLAELKRKNLISRENYLKLRKEIKARVFKDKAHIKERIAGIK